MSIQSAVAGGNYNNHEYEGFLARLKERFLGNIKDGAEPLFTTDADGLWEIYLASFPAGDERQHHNCSACRHFINRFASLVTIDEHGKTSPALLDDDDSQYGDALTAMAKAVRKAKVTGIFLSSEAVLGQPVTG